MLKKLNLIYKKLYGHFGSQKWWPADTPFEVIIGAILTQNTNWKNVEKAINNLKQRKLLSPQLLYNISQKKLAEIIKPAGYFNIKSKRLKAFLEVLFSSYGGNLKNMFNIDTIELRRVLLEVNGIGPETADSILLYAANRPVFVIDAYTKRIMFRIGLIDEGCSYEEAQSLFMGNLRKNAGLFNEYHALLVKLGKDICTKISPKCNNCPLGCSFGRLHTPGAYISNRHNKRKK